MDGSVGYIGTGGIVRENVQKLYIGQRGPCDCYSTPSTSPVISVAQRAQSVSRRLGTAGPAEGTVQADFFSK